MARRIVVDANRIFSALLRDGLVRHQVMTTEAQLFAPRFLRAEIEKHRGTIVRRSGAEPDQVEAALRILYRRISWVSDAEIRGHLAKARKALGHRDPKDVPYLACALAIKADGIWSMEDFDVQRLVARLEAP